MDMLDKIERDLSAVKSNYKNITDATIMIVDDEPSTLRIVQTFLEDAGYIRFVMVEKSSQAMNILEDTRPDVLILDIIMPEVSGFDILSAVRTHPRFKYLPVIIMTSHSDSESKIRALELGATDFLPKPLDESELCLRVRNTLAAKAFQDQIAYYDPLTNLPNKQLFMECLDWSLKKAKRYKEHLALLTIGLDHFSRISATMGSIAEDEVLRQIASRIESGIRSVDVIGSSLDDDDSRLSLFRTGGNAFSLLLDRIQSEESAAVVAERLIQILKQPVSVNNTDLHVSVSIGIATYPSDSDDSLTLLQLSSVARDYARNRGSNAFQFSSMYINETYNKRLSMETKLRKALEKEELLLHYQPLINIRTGKINGVEALLRWNNSEAGLVHPGDFIPLAEETGLIVPIGEWVLHRACAQLKEWHRAGKIPINMSVNLSVKQFADPQFLSMVKRIVVSSGADPQFLKLELTESLLLDDIKSKLKLLTELSDLGLKLSIDDFGTGYSSLSYLSKLPVDELKIDRSFVGNVVENSSNRAIVLSVIFLAHCLGLTTVAEGVEKKEQLEFLKKEQCDLYQGFLYSKPVSHTELTKLLASKNKKS